VVLEVHGVPELGKVLFRRIVPELKSCDNLELTYSWSNNLPPISAVARTLTSPLDARRQRRSLIDEKIFRGFEQ
jgi:hypothetical protein